MARWFLCSALVLAAAVPCAAQERAAAAPLAFKQFFDASPRALVPSARLTSLVGKRVAIAGYMAHMEAAPLGGFYLVPTPVFADESGGGTADLPPSAVLVTVSGAEGHPIDYVPGPLLVSGVLDVGPRTEPDGTLSRIRIAVADPGDVRAPAAATP